MHLRAPLWLRWRWVKLRARRLLRTRLLGTRSPAPQLWSRWGATASTAAGQPPTEVPSPSLHGTSSLVTDVHLNIGKAPAEAVAVLWVRDGAGSPKVAAEGMGKMTDKNTSSWAQGTWCSMGRLSGF